MDTKDLVTIAVAIIIVVLIAIFIRAPAPEQEGPQLPVPSETPTVSPGPTPTVIQTPHTSGPYRIMYSNDLKEYPRLRIPENMIIYGASDPPWKTSDVVEFAYLHEKHGGVSAKFSVPFPLWRINCSVEARIHPGSALVRWVLVHAGSGEILEGGEMRYPSSMTKNVQVSNDEMYFIIQADDIDNVTLSLETTRLYYETGSRAIQ